MATNKQLTIDTKGLDYDQRDVEVMLVLLKIIAYYHQQERTLFLGKWSVFFNNLFPQEVKKGSVFAAGRAKKHLQKKEYIHVFSPEGKEYHLISINSAKIPTIIDILEKNARDYDAELLELIDEFYKANDAPSGNFKSSTQAFDELGL